MAEAKITWNARKGDPEKHTSYGIVFHAGRAVKVDREEVIAKLRGNPYFTVEEKAEKPASDNLPGAPVA